MSYQPQPLQPIEQTKRTAARLSRIYTAAAYDIMDELGHPNQCLALDIKPMRADMRIAGPAFTIAGNNDPVEDHEYTFQEGAEFAYFKSMYEGCVVAISAAGEERSGHWGELMSTAAQARGAVGAVLDGGTRDANIIMGMKNWSLFMRHISPVEGRKRYRVRYYQQPIAMRGALTSQVRVNPGDWIFGDMDGGLCIPAGLVESVLKLAEERSEAETAARMEIRAGADVRATLDKYGAV